MSRSEISYSAGIQKTTGSVALELWRQEQNYVRRPELIGTSANFRWITSKTTAKGATSQLKNIDVC